MTLRPLVLAGAGGFARETAELVAALGPDGGFDLLGFLDDDPLMVGADVGGLPVLGPLDWVHDHPDVAVVLCAGNPGNPGVRRTIAHRLGLDDDRYATLVHPAASVASSASLGPGTVVHATTVLTADIELGAHVAVMPAVVLTHDDVVSDFVTIGAGVRVAGGVLVGEAAYLGSGCLIRERVTVGRDSLVGMGAVVTRDIPPGEVWVGSPARRLRTFETSGVSDPTTPPTVTA
ncbi:MAG TPA: NeuD/PglB/VioB family sugar acetyltransferase [Acidimicrobiales bacterium]